MFNTNDSRWIQAFLAAILLLVVPSLTSLFGLEALPRWVLISSNIASVIFVIFGAFMLKTTDTPLARFVENMLYGLCFVGAVYLVVVKFF